LGQATRAARYLEGLPKEYQATVRLGMETETDDLEGAVIEQKTVPELSAELVTGVLAVFTGEIEQIPPRYSALKKDGVPLYKLARQGRPVEPPRRRVMIHRIEVLRISREELDVRVQCSKGTYIRALARDIGRSLGCGGTLAALARTAVGPFTKEEAVPLGRLDRAVAEANGLGIDRALAFLPAVELDGAEAVKVSHGNMLPGTSGQADGAAIRLRHLGKLLAVGRAGQGGIRPECVFTAAG
jgi:tRNA pseudouridine55 synthase